MRRLLLASLLLGSACGPDEAIVTAIPAEPLLAPVEGQRLGPDGSYHRPAGVRIDASYLSGRPLGAVRDVLMEQAGAVQETRELPAGGGTELVLERARVRVRDELIYQLTVPLDPPLRRAEAIEALGFPPASARFVTLHREFRLHHAWEQRRVRLRRVAPDSDFVDQVEVWKFVPGEDGR
jgi:hypothetical protein